MTAIDDENLKKRYSLVNGQLQKTAIANLSLYNAISVKATLDNIMIAAQHGVYTIIAGAVGIAVENQTVKFLSASKFHELHPDKTTPFVDADGVLISTRTKLDLVPAPILLIDYDVDENTPAELKSLTPQQLIAKLGEIFPSFLTAGHVINYGSSSGIFAPDGTQLTPLGSLHIYFLVNNAADIERFKTVLKAKCILEGWYWEKTTKNNISILKTIFDPVAISHERLCYESSPILENGLTRKVPPPVKIDGGILDTQLLQDLDDSEIAALRTRMSCSKSVVVRAADNGKSIVISNIENDRLRPDTVITFADGTQTTPPEFYAANSIKSACYAPFRDDHTPSAFIARHADDHNVVFVHDSALNLTYFCNVSSTNIAVKSDGKPKVTIENFENLLNQYDFFPRYDMIKKNLLVSNIEDRYLPDNQKSAFLAEVSSRCAENELSISENKIKSYLVHIADKNFINPVADWIRSKPWDGQCRIDDLAATLRVKPELLAFRECAVRRWSIGCVASALSIKGAKNEIVLTLSGNQGIGKTTFFKSLAPAGSGWIKDGMSLNANNKDSVKQAISYWIVELGEIGSTFTKSDISSLKAFLSLTEDELRLPYASDYSNYPRRTAFCASVNGTNFLVDDTGNRRFAVLEVDKINRHNLDIQQLWAEVLTLYESGEQWWFTPEEEAMQSEINKNHQAIDSYEEMLYEHFKMDAVFGDTKGPKMSATEILQLFGVKVPNRGDTTRMGNILAAKGLKKLGRKYQMPQQIIQS